MSHPVKGIDHCFSLVKDLDKAAEQFAALGFTLSPRGLHSEAKGSANYTIMFPDDYFELLGLIKPTEMNAPRRKMLDDMGEGLHAIACRIDTAEKAAQELEALGIATHGLGSFARPVPLPGGGTGEAAFSTVAFTPEEVPLGTVFMCQHKTRDTVWIPELLSHANTACGLGGILAISADPAADAARFARLWADGQVSDDGKVYTVATGPNSAPLLLMSRDAMAEIYPGIDLSGTPKGAFTAMRVKVADMTALRACLEKAGITPIETALGLAVAPEHTSGTIVEFVTA
ncbi:VOC family protein [Lutimaribacter sp. EGI FJ00015]|uniref:VOC family protein n=1 Tax=Lutimaribacter degradans TaxID=2945989 RepID=A0ACC5ZTI2_9RHOB|nr:VOC family protein [Lutimaribacter sp. EGI FJ00013]MCM2561637.1 VOC family protein [Lutimaribacter sp. EGI FJ00013]MCO0612652.1 VOC family protein [Lutimaribacter sp. EGI FJ00015]MCO0635310.1 VOC family protein [Lutimaribacter sp. EGI FJ00014]